VRGRPSVTPRPLARPSRALLALATGAGVVAMIPLVYLAIRLAQIDPSRTIDLLTRPRTLELAFSTLVLVGAVSITAAVMGIASAVVLARTSFRGIRYLAVLAALPLAMPSYVAAYTWVATVPNLDGFFGTWMVMSAVTVPFVTLPVAAALRAADPAVEEVARSLGRKPWRAFMGATMPQLWPAAAAGTLLVALYTVSEYGTPAIMRHDVLTNALMTAYRASFDRNTAFVLAAVLIFMSLSFVVGENISRGRARRWRSARGAQRSAEARTLGLLPTLLGGLLMAAPAVVALFVPGYALIRRIVGRGGTTIDWSELATAIWNTILLAGSGAALALLLALPVGVLAARWRTRSAVVLESTAYAGNAMPGIVVGLSLVAATLAFAPRIYQTVFTVAIAYAVLFLPKAVGSVRAATAAVPPALEEVARALGRSSWGAWRTVTLRLTAPGVAVGGLLALVSAMKELPATLLLRPTGMDTLATEMWTRTAVTAYSAAAPYALALVLLAAIPAFFLSGALVSATSLSTTAPKEPEVIP
jgi:iron(III) transport system permease protein